MSRALRRRYGRSYEMFAIYPRARGGGFGKKCFKSGEARDAWEALSQLQEAKASNPYGRQQFFIIDVGDRGALTKGKRKLGMGVVVTEEELRARLKEGR